MAAFVVPLEHPTLTLPTTSPFPDQLPSASGEPGPSPTVSTVSTVSAVPDGSLEGVLDSLRDWLGTYISVTDILDLSVVALWAAHTHVAQETYSSPRLIIDSSMHGSGKTTLLEHLQRFSLSPVQAASISSPALLARMQANGLRTILIDEADRSLDPKKPGVEELIAMINSGYKRGSTRPVLIQGKGGEWDVVEMPTYAPVAMAGNAPNLPDDTRSRSIRVLLMPDLTGSVESSDWEEIEEDASALADALASAMDDARDHVRTARPALPTGCIGRIKERWSPLMRVADAAGGSWPEVTWKLIERDIHEAEMEREDGLAKRPPAVVLLQDLYAVWPEGTPFCSTSLLISYLKAHNPSYWCASPDFSRDLTPQRMGRLLSQAFKIYASKNSEDVRGYQRTRFETAWRRFGLTPANEPSGTAETVETVGDAR